MTAPRLMTCVPPMLAHFVVLDEIFEEIAQWADRSVRPVTAAMGLMQVATSVGRAFVQVAMHSPVTGNFDTLR